MRLFVVAFIASFLTVASSMDFLSPPPQGTDDDFENNQVYPEDTVVDIAWTGEMAELPLSLVLFQGNDSVFDYIFWNVTNKTTWKWTVATTKNLTVSNLFFLAIFVEGFLSPEAQSRYFNITSRNTLNLQKVQTSTTSSANVVSSTHSLTTSSTRVSSTSTPTLTSSPTSIIPPTSPSGLTTGGMIGLGAGVLSAMIVGLGIGWFLFGRKKRGNDTPVAPASQDEATSVPGQMDFAEAQPKWDSYAILYPHQTVHEVPPEGTPMATAPYELGNLHSQQPR